MSGGWCMHSAIVIVCTVAICPEDPTSSSLDDEK